VTHAAAATLHGIAYVIGGRGATVGSAVRRVTAIDTASGHLRAAGSLAEPRSDLAAVAVPGAILLAGGSGSTGTTARIGELIPAPRTRFTKAPASTTNVYAADSANALSAVVRHDRPLVYVPNSESNSVSVINPNTYRVIGQFPVGMAAEKEFRTQHVRRSAHFFATHPRQSPHRWARLSFVTLTQNTRSDRGTVCLGASQCPGAEQFGVVRMRDDCEHAIVFEAQFHFRAIATEYSAAMPRNPQWSPLRPCATVRATPDTQPSANRATRAG